MNLGKNMAAILMIAISFTFASCSNSQSANKSGTATEQNKDNTIDFDKAFIVDVRTPGEFASGHLEGAINIPLNEIDARAEEFEGKDQIVVYCRSGARSGSAKTMLEKKGVENIINGVNTQTLEKIKKEQGK